MTEIFHIHYDLFYGPIHGPGSYLLCVSEEDAYSSLAGTVLRNPSAWDRGWCCSVPYVLATLLSVPATTEYPHLDLGICLFAM